MYAVFKNNRMITVSLDMKLDDGLIYISITREKRRELYMKGYSNHILVKDQIVYSPKAINDNNSTEQKPGQTNNNVLLNIFKEFLR